jgi:hypothetical protein
MLPPSIVHNPAFVDYIKYLDPAFQMPTCRTLKKTTLSKMKIMVQNKIKSVLANIPFINTSMDDIVNGIYIQYQLLSNI